jgi:hypothetical protein
MIEESVFFCCKWPACRIMYSCCLFFASPYPCCKQLNCARSSAQHSEFELRVLLLWSIFENIFICICFADHALSLFEYNKEDRKTAAAFFIDSMCLRKFLVPLSCYLRLVISTCPVERT